MDERPDLAELQEHVDIVEWLELGIQLKLPPNKLKEIAKSYPLVPDARREMFMLWLKSSTATRKQLIKALKSSAVREQRVADRYKEYAKAVPALQQTYQDADKERAGKLCRCYLMSGAISISVVTVIFAVVAVRVFTPEWWIGGSQLNTPAESQFESGANTAGKVDPESLVYTAGAKGAAVVEATLAKIANMKRNPFPDDKRLMRRLAYVMSKDGESYSWENDGGIWQVSEYAFKDTKNEIGHIHLPRKYDYIREAFGIEWPLVERKDLEKPLYSALAARLFLSNVPEPIPPAHARQKQAVYWKRFYMAQHTGNDGTDRFIKGVDDLEGQNEHE